MNTPAAMIQTGVPEESNQTIAKTIHWNMALGRSFHRYMLVLIVDEELVGQPEALHSKVALLCHQQYPAKLSSTNMDAGPNKHQQDTNLSTLSLTRKCCRQKGKGPCLKEEKKRKRRKKGGGGMSSLYLI